jgi:glutathione peroxidase
VLKRFLPAFAVAALLLAEPAAKLSIYDFNLPDIDGKMLSFSQFKGKVLLIVNVADNSIYTPQYQSLEGLYQKYRASGLLVLGFPSNDFGNEEPDNEAKIKSFCVEQYHVTFPLFSKLAVRGDQETPLFHYLTKEADPKIKGDVHWNFTKFVIDRKGKLAARFEPDVQPDDPDLLVAIENAFTPKESAPNQQTPPAPPRGDRPTRRTRAGE